ncbi:hypothetical protein [Rhizosaccharibacter radicis]|uniref:ABC transmembrane type-1 domain-containing protein n=1 Tax=Rhizosaccharibacter radicis TaxID=2782605 RepID=A0ABT1VSC4_9PROT|nr:hypothetical protein [Acetobacteraceae bacterium KSS12]
MPSLISPWFLVPAAIAITLAGGALALMLRFRTPPAFREGARIVLLLLAVPTLLLPFGRAMLPPGAPIPLHLLADHRLGWMVSLLPVSVLLLVQPLRGWGAHQSRSLRGLGVGPWLALRRVWLPLLAPALLASVLACAALLLAMGVWSRPPSP